MGVFYGMCILVFVVELISTFQLSRKRVTFSFMKLSIVSIQSNCERLEGNHWLILGMIILHTYMTLLSAGSIIRKDVTSTTNKYYWASRMRGLFLSILACNVPKHLSLLLRCLRNACCETHVVKRKLRNELKTAPFLVSALTFMNTTYSLCYE